MMIASCNGESCTVKDECKRYTTKPDSYDECLSILATSKTEPFDGCGKFIDVESDANDI